MSGFDDILAYEPEDIPPEILSNGGKPLENDLHEHDPKWWEKFQYDRYDWNNFDPPYTPILLTQGFFMIVDKRAPKRITSQKCCADVRHNRETGEIMGVYAVTRMGGRRVYVHREIARAAPSEMVDHVNHYSLDNRKSKNLVIVSRSLNVSNYPNRRTKKFYPGIGILPRGVYLVKNKDGSVRFKAHISVQGSAYNSSSFENPEEAHRWYVSKHKELFPKRNKGWLRKVRSEPIFPPEKHIPMISVPRTSFLADEDVPF